MPIITLTTDFGTKDYFIGAVKGAVYSEMFDAKIVDITHNISPFNITETAYILKNAYKSFPQGSIHIIGVDTELTEENSHIALKLDNHFFICPNNGTISMIAADIRPEKIVEINIHKNIPFSTFPELNVFVKVACHIIRGGSLDVIGKPIERYKKMMELKPTISKSRNKITGSVIYIDNYGNVITNITKKMFTSISKGRQFEILANRYSFRKIYNRYSDIINFSLPVEQRKKDGTRLAIFNTSDFLEIAIFKSNLSSVGGASSLLGLEYRDRITVTFQDRYNTT